MDLINVKKIYKLKKEKNTKKRNSEIEKEWHPTKNKDLTPKDVFPKSGKKVWWQCKKGHEWETTVAHRSNGHDCPYCTNRKVCKDNCLATVNPLVAREWHPKKNGKLTPKDIIAGSSKVYWWKCNKGHEWKAKVCDRNNGKRKCPKCEDEIRKL